MSATITRQPIAVEAFNARLDEIEAANNDRDWPGSGDASVFRAIARIREADAVLRARESA